jgi:hypothetical protein
MSTEDRRAKEHLLHCPGRSVDHHTILRGRIVRILRALQKLKP